MKYTDRQSKQKLMKGKGAQGLLKQDRMFIDDEAHNNDGFSLFSQNYQQDDERELFGYAGRYVVI